MKKTTKHYDLKWIYTIKLDEDLKKRKEQHRNFQMAREIREFLTRRFNELDRKGN